MDQNKLIALSLYLQVLAGDDTPLPDNNVILGISSNIDNVLNERKGLPAAMDITADFE